MSRRRLADDRAVPSVDRSTQRGKALTRKVTYEGEAARVAGQVALSAGSVVLGGGPSVTRIAGRYGGENQQPVQRVLAHNAPINQAEVGQVRQIQNKLVFILSGIPAVGGSVVIKIEVAGAAAESASEFAARERATQSLAEVAMVAVPAASSLNVADRAALMALDPAVVVGDVAPLQAALGNVGVVGHLLEKAIVLKKQAVNAGKAMSGIIKDATPPRVGQLYTTEEDFVGGARARKGAIKLRAGDPHAKAALLAILSDPGICNALGRTATFDLLTSNLDRFNEAGEVNTENLDIAHIPGFSSTFVPLDNLSIQHQLKAHEWQGDHYLHSRANMNGYAQSVVAYLMRKAHIDIDPGPLVLAFTAGMVAAAIALKTQENGLFQAFNRWVPAGNQQAAAVNKVQRILHARLLQVNPV